MLYLVATALLQTAAVAELSSAKSSAKIIEAVASDEAEMKAYCAMLATIANGSEDEKPAEAESVQTDEYLKALGPDFEEAYHDSANLEAISKLDEKCG